MSAPGFPDIRSVVPAAQAGVRSAQARPEKSELREAAEGFEAILVRRLLASAKAGSFAEDSPFTGKGVEQFETMRNETFADIAANSGEFGIASALARQLTAQPAPSMPRNGGRSCPAQT